MSAPLTISADPQERRTQLESMRMRKLALSLVLVVCTSLSAKQPVRARKAEAMLEAGGTADAVGALGEDLKPGDDLHASAALKLHLAGVLLRRVAGQLTEARP